MAMNLKLDPRFLNLSKFLGVRRPEDAAVEMITNADDAYDAKKRLNPDLIEGDGSRSVIIEVTHNGQDIYFIDQALGMTATDLENKILTVGANTRDSTESRGIFSTGTATVTSIGPVEYHCIKDGKYSACIIKNATDAGFIVDSNGVTLKDVPVTEEIRSMLKISGNGVCVHQHLMYSYRIQNHEVFFGNVVKTVSLRDINSNKKYHIVGRILQDDKSSIISERNITYAFPSVEKKIFEEKMFKVPGYENVYGYFTLYKTHVALQETANLSELQYGIVIQSKKALHEQSFFGRDAMFRDNIAMPYLVGRLRCPHIMDLMEDFERTNGSDEKNPIPILDPFRKGGVDLDHPFVKQLYSVPAAWLEAELSTLADELDDNLLLSDNVSAFTQNMAIFGENFLAKQENFMKYYNDENGEFISALKDINENYSVADTNEIQLQNVKPTSTNNNNETDNVENLLLYRNPDPPEYEQLKNINYGSLEDYINKNDEVENTMIANVKRDRPKFVIKFSAHDNPRHHFSIHKTKSEVVMVLNLKDPKVQQHLAFNETTKELSELSTAAIEFLANSVTEAFTRLIIPSEPIVQETDFSKLTNNQITYSVFESYDSIQRRIKMTVANSMTQFVEYYQSPSKTQN